MEFIANWTGATTNDEFFVAGMMFVYVFLFLVSVIELPFALREIAWAKRRAHLCELHRSGALFQKPCRDSNCPCHNDCPFYEKFSFVSWFRKKMKKP